MAEEKQSPVMALVVFVVAFVVLGGGLILFFSFAGRSSEVDRCVSGLVDAGAGVSWNTSDERSSYEQSARKVCEDKQTANGKPSMVSQAPPGSTSAPSGAALKSWIATSKVSALMKQIDDDLKAMIKALDSVSVSGMERSCTTLKRHVASLDATLPSPDAELTASLKTIVDHYAKVAQLCLDGDYPGAGEELGAASDALNRAMTIIDRND